MSDYNLGTARGRIRVDYDGRGVAEARSDFTALGRSQDRSREGLRMLGATAGISSLAIAAGLGLAIKTAIEFEKQISAIGAVSNATAEQMDALRKKALQLGASTAFSASEAALAMEELAKAGVSVEGILTGAADAAVALAAAGGIDLPQAAEIAANAMNTFGLSAREMPRVADLIAGAANSSAISVHDFGFSLAQAGAAADLVGLKFDDLAVAIALMGQNGIKGSDAGTSLKTMLLNLQPVTAKQTKLFKELGIVTKSGSNQFFDARGNIKSMSEIAGILNRTTKDMTAQQRALTLEMIFGSDAIRAAAVLTEAGAEGFDNMATAMGKVTAADVAAKRLDNTAGALEQMKGAVETAAIALGTVFLPVVKNVAQIISRVTNAFTSLDPKWQKLIGLALTAAAVILAVIAALAGIGLAILGVGAALGAVKIVAILGLVLAAVIAIGLALREVWLRSEAFREAVTTGFNAIRQGAQKIARAFLPFVRFVRDELIPMLRTGIKQALENMRPAFEAITKFIREQVVPGFERMRVALDKAMPTIIQIARFLGQNLVASLGMLGKIIGFVVPLLVRILGPSLVMLGRGFAFLLENLPAIVSFLTKVFTVLKIIGMVIGALVIGPLFALYKAATFVFSGIAAAVRVLLGIWQAVWGFFGPTVKAVFGLIATIVSAGFSIIRALVTTALGFLLAYWRTIFNAFMAIARPVWSLIARLIGAALDFIVPKVQAAFNFVLAIVRGVHNAVAPIVQAAWARIQDIIKAAVARVTALMDGLRAIVEKVRSFFNQLKAAADGGTGSLIAFVKTIPGKVLAALGSLASTLFNKGREMIQGLIDGILSMASTAGNAARGVVDKIAGFLPGSPAKEGPLSGRGYVRFRGEHLVEDFSLGIVRQAGAAERAIEQVLRDMASVLPSDRSGIVRRSAVGAMPSVQAGVAPTRAPAMAQTLNVDVDVNVPNAMNPAEVAKLTARKVSNALLTRGATAQIPPVTVNA